MSIKKSSTKCEMGYDIIEDIKKTKENISLFEMCNLPQQRKKLLEAFDAPVNKPKDDIQSEEEISEESIGGKSKSITLPFLLSFEIFNHNMHNCLVDYGAATSVMPLSICKKINGKPTLSAEKTIQLDRITVKVVGEMNDVLIRLATDERVCQFIDIMVVDIPEAYGLILSRDWYANLDRYFATNWSHLWFPYNNY